MMQLNMIFNSDRTISDKFFSCACCCFVLLDALPARELRVLVRMVNVRMKALGLGLLSYLCWAAPAAAAPSSLDDAGSPNVDALMRELAHEVDALSVTDCTLACKALGSMERSRDRICELSPGARCDEARAKVQDAQKRVAGSCPACAVHEQPMPAPPSNDAKASTRPAADSPSSGSVSAEHARGGCAGCATTDSRGMSGDAALLVLAGLALLRTSRRRKR
jgi:MYXO-CTERM domain-containing protein